MSKVSTNAARSFIHRTPRRENNTVVTVQELSTSAPFWLDSDDNLSM